MQNAAACALHRWSNTFQGQKLVSRYKYTGSVNRHVHFWNVVVDACHVVHAWLGRLETYVTGQRVHEDSLGYSRKKTGRSMCTQCR